MAASEPMARAAASRPCPRRCRGTVVDVAGSVRLALLGVLLATPVAAHVPDSTDAHADYPLVWHDNDKEQLGPTRIENEPVVRQTPAWTGASDDDGVFFNDPGRTGNGRLVKGEMAEITVDFRNLKAKSAFGLWFDWNQDNTWSVGERKIWAGAGVSSTPPDGPISSGIKTFYVQVPESPNADDEIQVRARVWNVNLPAGQTQALNPDAPRADKVAYYGEVEDYLVPLDPVPPPPVPDLVFEDDFESGDLGSWSSLLP